MPARPPTPGPTVFEIDLGPSTLSLMLSTIFRVRYLDIPISILMIFHIAWFVVYFIYRQSLVISSIQFLFCCLFIAITENLNSFFGAHWRGFRFSKDYFDESCIFTFLFWTLPMTIVAGLITLNLFIDLCKSVAVHRYFRKILPRGVAAQAKPADDGKLKQD
jgi:hypothetical protein